MELIDKAAVVAEIEKRIAEGEKVAKELPSSAIMGLIQAYKNTLSFLDTIEVKEVEEPTFDDFIQEGDKITVNEDGSRFNRSQLERVTELSRYSKPYEAKRVKRTPADTEAAMKEIDELSKAFTEAHPEGGDQMLREIRGEYHIVDNNEMVSEELEEAASQYSFNIPSAIFNDLTPVLQNIWKHEIEGAFIAGAKLQEEQIMKNAIEREVKVDAGGYPYINATELYDYDNDKPLAKAGDMVKVVFIKDK